MHCVTDYPVSDNFANINCISSFIKDFKLVIGYSDHTIGDLGQLSQFQKVRK